MKKLFGKPLRQVKNELWGKAITVRQTLYKNMDYGSNNDNPSEYVMEWKTKDQEPRAGVVVGFRTVYNGIYNALEDTLERFTQVEGVHHMLVSYWHDKEPVRVPLTEDAFELGGTPEPIEKQWPEFAKDEMRKDMQAWPRDKNGRLLKKNAVSTIRS